MSDGIGVANRVIEELRKYHEGEYFDHPEWLTPEQWLSLLGVLDNGSLKYNEVQREMFCEHRPSVRIIEKIDSLGRNYFAQLCDFCDVTVGQIKKSEADEYRLIKNCPTSAQDAISACTRRVRELTRSAHRNEWFSKYDQYLSSPEWDTQRKRILHRDNYTCQGCGEKNVKLHVHHMSYTMHNKIGRAMDYELRTLCISCHEAHHDHMASK